MEKVSIPGMRLDGVRLDFPSRFIISALPYLWDDEKNHQICFLSSSQWSQATKRNEFGSMISSADIVLPTSPSLVTKVLERGEKSERTWPVPFAYQFLLDALQDAEEFSDPETQSTEFSVYRPQSVLTQLLSAIEKRAGSVFLIGGTPIVLLKAEKNIRATYPGITIVGSMHGMYRREEEGALLLAIQKSTPNLILAGDPLPEGERWIPRHMSATRSGTFVYFGSIMRWFSGR